MSITGVSKRSFQNIFFLKTSLFRALIEFCVDLLKDGEKLVEETSVIP